MEEFARALHHYPSTLNNKREENRQYFLGHAFDLGDGVGGMDLVGFTAFRPAHYSHELFFSFY